MTWLWVMSYLILLMPIAVGLYRVWDPPLVHIVLVGVIAGGGFLGLRVEAGQWWFLFPEIALVIPVTLWAFKKKRDLRDSS